MKFSAFKCLWAKFLLQFFMALETHHMARPQEIVSSLNSSVVKANICVPKSLQCSQRNEFCHWLQWEVWPLKGQADVSSAGNILQLSSAAALIFFLWCLLKLIFFFTLKLNYWDLYSVLSLEVSFPFFFLNKLALQASSIVQGFV